MNHLNPSSLNHTAAPLLSVSYKSPELLDKLLNHLPDAVIITDANFNITGINHSAEEIYGFRSDETVGKLLFSLLEFEVTGSTWGETIKELYTNGFWNGELAYKHLDFKKIYFNTTCTLIRNDKGSPIAVVFVNHNITEKILQNENLAIVENKYQTLVESLSDGVVMINSKGLIETANKRAVEILGFSKEEIEGKVVASPSWDAIKDDGSFFPIEEFPAIETLNTGEEKNNVIMGIRQQNGTRRWLSVNSRPIFKSGKTKPEAVVTSFEDITQAREIKKKLNESDQLFRAFMTNTPNLGWVYDEEGTFIYGNPYFMERIGLTENDIGKNITELGTPEMYKTILAKNKLVIENGESIITEDLLLEKDGTESYFLAHWFPLNSENGKKLIGGHSVDITERKKMREELMNSRIQEQRQINIAAINAQEEERNRLSEELHDNVNQLLISSKLHIGAAKTADKNKDELLDKASKYILMAVDEIRKLSKSLNSKIISNIGIEKSLNEIFSNLSYLANIEIETNVGSGILEKLTNEQQIMVFRVVQEQSNNILKYAEASKVFINVTEEENYFKLTIKDNGKGFNVSDTHSEKFSGIGFTNVRSRVGACNGTLNIISSPGNGCSLEIIFPA